MKKFSSYQTVFYVTNVCNFNCQDCNSYNNYHFAGVTKWKDVAETYAKWAEIFDPGYWEVCGGEIMTSPDWLDWVKGVNAIWPKNHGRILTNGSLLKKHENKMGEFYTILANSDGKIDLRISLHDRSRWDEIFAWAIDFLGPTWHPFSLQQFEENFINNYNRIKADHWPNLACIADWYQLPKEIQDECTIEFNVSPETTRDVQLKQWLEYMQDPNDLKSHYLAFLTNADKVKVIISSEDLFYKSAVQYDPINQDFTITRSNPDVSHDNCQEKCFKKGVSVPIFFSGKLYKCLHSKLFPDFESQYNLPITEEERRLINSYIPASLDMSIKELEHWFETRNDKIFTCTFCPETYVERQHIVADTKKIFIKKKSRQ